MGRRGRKRQLEVEAEYWQLLKAGVGTVAACRLVGITRKTGYRWRAENGGIPPVRLAETARTSRYLSLLERQRIATLRGHGHGAPRDRPAPGPVAVHGQPRAAPQPAPARPARL
jgi:transposase, IS30 family